MAAKKGFFQKGDQKKQYSQKVLHDVEDAYRPKSKKRARNPISSNTMSGEDPDAGEEKLEPVQQASMQSRFKKAVDYAFAGPQAKRKKKVELQPQSVAEETPETVAAQVFAPPESLRTSVPEVLEAMQALEADVQESRGNYEPIQESEIQSARKLGLKSLLFNHASQLENQNQVDMQYQLEFGAIDADEFHCSSGEVGLTFEPQDYRNDAKKTQMLNVPTQGIKRSNRGTIEAVYQPNGNVVQAQYNRCGILVEVNIAGAMRLTRSAETGKWSMSCSDGSSPANSVDNVGFDKLGNLCYSTDDGHTTMICADGRVIQRA
jgi:hypothetical protein